MIHCANPFLICTNTADSVKWKNDVWALSESSEPKTSHLLHEAKKDDKKKERKASSSKVSQEYIRNIIIYLKIQSQTNSSLLDIVCTHRAQKIQTQHLGQAPRVQKTQTQHPGQAPRVQKTPALLPLLGPAPR